MPFVRKNTLTNTLTHFDTFVYSAKRAPAIAMEVSASPAFFFDLNPFLARRGRSTPGRRRTDKLRWRPCTFCGLEKRLFDWAVSLRRCRGFFTVKKDLRGQVGFLTAVVF